MAVDGPRAETRWTNPIVAGTWESPQGTFGVPIERRTWHEVLALHGVANAAAFF